MGTAGLLSQCKVLTGAALLCTAALCSQICIPTLMHLGMSTCWNKSKDAFYYPGW